MHAGPLVLLCGSLLALPAPSQSSRPPLLRVRPDAEGPVWFPRSGDWFDRILVLPDRDGDGAEDVLLTLRAPMLCSQDIPQGALLFASGRTGALLYSGSASRHFDPDLYLMPETGQLEVLLRTEHHGRRVELRSRPGIGEPARWFAEDRDGPLRSMRCSAFLPALRGDASPAVVVGDAWETAPESEEWVGAVCLLAGDDGRVLWKRYGSAARNGFGWDVGAAGDLNRDGVPDVAVLCSSVEGEDWGARLEGRCGASGDLLVELTCPEAEFGYLQPLPDVDGDGLPEWSFGGLVVSLAAECRLDVADGGTLRWVADAGDFDGDGARDLFVGRQHPRTGRRQMGVVTRSGPSWLEFVPGEQRSWVRCLAAGGDFDGDGEVDLLFASFEDGRTGRSQRVTFTPHARLR